MPHPPVRAAGVAPPTSYCRGAQPVLVRRQVAQGAWSRASLAARGGGGGVGAVLGSYVSLLSQLSSLIFLVSHTNKHGFDKTPPLPREFLSVESHAMPMQHTMLPCPA